MKAENKEIALRDPSQYELSTQDVVAQVGKIQAIMKAAMKEGEHYGVIPGTIKPTLLKAGAEKLCLTFRLDPQYESVETMQGEHLTVKTKCTLYHIITGMRMGSGEASCSTKETKYAFRDAKRKCPECGKETIIKGKEEYGGGWLCFKKQGGCGAKFKDGNEDIERQVVGKVATENLADEYNVVLKMANKRALVAATLNVTAASDIFTQDMEDHQAAVPSASSNAGKPERDQAVTAAAAVFESPDTKPVPCDKHKTPWKINNKGQYWHQVAGKAQTCWLGVQLWDGFVKWAKVAEQDTAKALGDRIWFELTDKARQELCAEMEEAARIKLEADQPPA